ncbi:DUF3379 family protein [Pseudoalteromonas sp. A22]|uniref:DUF3379 family protein n=1 Tax=Pseudoalteromonas sp. A22 TaxID=327511 RepID=UPI001BACDB15|nr:DUF3379 family protein [Pseudoalteromonas sp. A22]QUI61267.1 DUF3379 family protein [Pseudoalteromonas sp. A22]
MDELEFRRRLVADPHDEEVKKQAEQQPELQALVEEMQAFDDFLGKSLDIDVPEGLADKIIAKQKELETEEHKVVKMSWFRRATAPFAIAASVFFAAVVFYFGGFGHPVDTGEHALAHVYYEENALQKQESVSLQTVNEKLAMFGGKFDNLPGKVVYATFCNFKGQKSLHLVMQSEFGPLTVFVVPAGQQSTIDGKDSFGDNRFEGLIAHDGKANTILVANRGTPIETFQSEVTSSLRWL